MSESTTKLNSEVTQRTVVPLRHPGRWIAIIVVGYLAAIFIHSLFTNTNYRWHVVGEFFFSPAVLQGLFLTILLTVVAMVIGSLVGLILAFMRMSASRFLQGVAAFYVWVFRGTPLLVQLILVYNLSFLYPELSLGIPFGGPQWIAFDTNILITPLLAAILCLGLNEAAFMCEVIRGGLLSVDRGQIEAAESLGMRSGPIRKRIVVPQAMRSILPPTGNQVISLLKATSMVSVIAASDLLYSVQTIYTRNYEVVPLLLVATIWYLIVTSLLMVGQHFIEKHYAKGRTREGGLLEEAGPPILTRSNQALIKEGVPA